MILDDFQDSCEFQNVDGAEKAETQAFNIGFSMHFASEFHWFHWFGHIFEKNVSFHDFGGFWDSCEFQNVDGRKKLKRKRLT